MSKVYMYVWYVCVYGMYGMYIWYVCVACIYGMYGMHVWYVRMVLRGKHQPPNPRRMANF